MRIAFALYGRLSGQLQRTSLKHCLCNPRPRQSRFHDLPFLRQLPMTFNGPPHNAHGLPVCIAMTGGYDCVGVVKLTDVARDLVSGRHSDATKKVKLAQALVCAQL